VVDVFDNDVPAGQAGRVLAQAAFNVECGTTRTSAAAATIGDLDCNTVLVPVMLDNTGSAEPTTFVVQARPFRTSDDPTYFHAEQLPPGAKRIVQAGPDGVAPMLDLLDAGPFTDTDADDVLLATRDFTSDFATCVALGGADTLPSTGG
jgi:hypothetical protein